MNSNIVIFYLFFVLIIFILFYNTFHFENFDTKISTREVVCVDQTGNVVDSSLCTGNKPNTQKICMPTTTSTLAPTTTTTLVPTTTSLVPTTTTLAPTTTTTLAPTTTTTARLPQPQLSHQQLLNHRNTTTKLAPTTTTTTLAPTTTTTTLAPTTTTLAPTTTTTTLAPTTTTTTLAPTTTTTKAPDRCEGKYYKLKDCNKKLYIYADSKLIQTIPTTEDQCKKICCEKNDCDMYLMQNDNTCHLYKDVNTIDIACGEKGGTWLNPYGAYYGNIKKKLCNKINKTMLPSTSPRTAPVNYCCTNKNNYYNNQFCNPGYRLECRYKDGGGGLQQNWACGNAYYGKSQKVQNTSGSLCQQVCVPESKCKSSFC